jgi:hypothetical protein
MIGSSDPMHPGPNDAERGQGAPSGARHSIAEAGTGDPHGALSRVHRTRRPTRPR